MQLLEKLKEEANSEQAAALSASIEKQIAELHISFSRKIYLNFLVSRLELFSHLWLILPLAGLKSPM